MKPVTQTEVGVGNPRANCLMACIASIWEMDLADLPDIYEAEQRGIDWYVALCDALRPFGHVPVIYDQKGVFPPIAPHGYHIACGQSPRDPEGKHGHAVVARDGRVVHDPHPTRAGLLGGITWWILLMPAPCEDPTESCTPPEVAQDLRRLRDEFDDGRWLSVDPDEDRRWAGTPTVTDWIEVLDCAATIVEAAR